MSKRLLFETAPPGSKESWANPVLANGRIYVRNADKMAALDVKK